MIAMPQGDRVMEIFRASPEASTPWCVGAFYFHAEACPAQVGRREKCEAQVVAVAEQEAYEKARSACQCIDKVTVF